MGAREPTPVFLSTRAIGRPGYADLRVRGGLVHLDGLHRLVSWELNTVLADAGVAAYVAGL
ncbi:hypothetical protein SAMN05216174_12245 [Actinokineospora iranica]|uniref:Uncharacterized protein n=1 Tax=Actinokineospora iranica TaxID=1271860 RepID=A0A1G6YLS2_9PSEU|nr:hypothetical protein SAMN05216174_12245 [Actinokineospora iranica]